MNATKKGPKRFTGQTILRHKNRKLIAAVQRALVAEEQTTSLIEQQDEREWLSLFESVYAEGTLIDSLMKAESSGSTKLVELELVNPIAT